MIQTIKRQWFLFSLVLISAAVIFDGSDTLALSVMIQVTYLGEFGIALLVCVIHHIVHLMMDGYLSAKMNTRLSGKNQ